MPRRSTTTGTSRPARRAPRQGQQGLTQNNGAARDQMQEQQQAAAIAAARLNQPLYPTIQQLFPVPRNPNEAAETVIHHGHLRSPRPGPVTLADGAPKLYRYVRGFALDPTDLDLNRPIHNFTFSIERNDINRVPAVQAPRVWGEPFARTLLDGSILYRLRCVEINDNTTKNIAPWLNEDCAWPSGLFIELNGHDCEPRRIPQYLRNHPVDVSTFVNADRNRVEVAYEHMEGTPVAFGPKVAIAVEIIHTISYTSILANLRVRPSADVLKRLVSSLTKSGQDADLHMVSSNRKISLLDAYSGLPMSRHPVRAQQCTHLECFDLENHLAQRPREQPGYPCQVDGWRCPICRGDARPNVLYVDGFILEVCKELKSKEMKDVTAILVDEKGGWKPADKTSRASASPIVDLLKSGDASKTKKRKAVDVIELD